jgi:hypothetical protein
VIANGETVNFYCNGIMLESAQLQAGVARLITSSLPTGSGSVTAEYAGDAEFLASASHSVSVSVQPMATVLSLTSSVTSAAYGQSVTLTAVLSPYSAGNVTTDGQTVSFKEGNSGQLLGTVNLSGGIAQLTTTALPAGRYYVTASYSGSVSFQASSSTAILLTIALPAFSQSLGQPSATFRVSAYFPSAVTVGSYAVLTLGAPNLDFQDEGSTCAAGSYPADSSCVVNVRFNPLAPGLRRGAVVVYDNASPHHALVTVPLSDVGVGAAVAFPPGIINTYAGGGLGCTNESDNFEIGDGCTATSASFSGPTGLALDGAGNLYIADFYNDVVRKVDAKTNVITTVAGNQSGAIRDAYGDYFSGDGGPATSAELYTPQSVVVDGAGNLYIADSYDKRIRKVDAANGNISTVAGSGATGYTGDGQAATAAELNIPKGLAIDGDGNLYISDGGNNVVRMVNAGTGIINTVVGGGSSPSTCEGSTNSLGDGCQAVMATLSAPRGLALDAAGNLYIADAGDGRIRMVTRAGIISTIAGNGSSAITDQYGNPYSGDGGPATAAELSWPLGLAIDAAGNLYLADDYQQRVRMVNAATGIITTVAGNGYESGLAGPGGYSGEGGPATSAELNSPYGLALDGAGNLYIGDSGNNVIRKVNVSDPPTVNFGSSNLSSQTLTVANLGNAQLNILGLEAPYPANFKIVDSGTTCAPGTAVAAAGTCSLEVEFTPESDSSISGGLVLIDNSMSESLAMQYIPLTGTGATVATTLTLQPSPTASVFGQSVTLTATLSPSASGKLSTDGETVSFYNGSVLLGAGTLSGGVATLTTTALPTGTDSLTASYTPAPGDTTFLASTSTAVSFAVSPAAPSVTTWPTSGAIIYGQTLSGAALSGGVASVPGTFAFASPTTVPTAGAALQSVIFTPTDGADYTTVTGSVSVAIAQATPAVVSWPTAAAISYGAQLSVATLSGGGATAIVGGATVTVSGSFSFAAPSSTPGVGTALQVVVFTPTDASDFANVTGTVSVTVNPATPTVTAWPTAATITYGQPLSASTLTGGAASVSGKFTFTTPAAVPAAGTSKQSVTFTPWSKNYGTATGAVIVTVQPAVLTVTANNQTMIYGGTVPALTFTYGGFVNRDGASAVTTAPTCTTAASSATAAGNYSITCSGGVAASYTLQYVAGTLTISPATPAITIAPGTVLLFGNQAAGTEGAAQVVTVTNSGTTPVALSSVTLAGTNAASFKMSNLNCYRSLAPSASCTVSLRFYPPAAGAASATLNIADNAVGSPQTVTLTGTGMAPTVTLSASSLSFGNQAMGTEGAAQIITVTNSGTLPVALGAVTLTGSDAASFKMSNLNCYGSLVLSASCTVNVRFYPPAAGAASATLNIADNAVGSPQTVTLTGTGMAPTVSLSATNLSFGNQAAGTEGAVQTITVTNTGTLPVALSSVTLTGTNAASFKMSNLSCYGSLLTGASCAVNLRFYPSAAGGASATLSVADNAVGSPQTVTLTGTGD